MKLTINIKPEEKYIYWKFAELKAKYQAETWIDLLEIIIDKLENENNR